MNFVEEMRMNFMEQMVPGGVLGSMKAGSTLCIPSAASKERCDLSLHTLSSV